MLSESDHIISHNFNLDGPIPAKKHFSVTCNELFHMMYLNQKCFSAQIWPFFLIARWIIIHANGPFWVENDSCVEDTM